MFEHVCVDDALVTAQTSASLRATVVVAALTLLLVLPGRTLGQSSSPTGGASNGAHGATSDTPTHTEPSAGSQGHEGHTVRESAQPSISGMAEVSVPFERRQLIGVRTEALQRRDLTRSIRTVGIVAADERQVRHIHTKISGWVEELFASFTGEQVKAGDPILSIYSPDLVSTQREYLLALEASQAQSGKDRPMRQLLDSTRTRLLLWDLGDAQIRELERTRTPQRAVTLRSPISGYVTMKPVYAGMYVTPEMELYTVSDLSRVWIWAELYEAEIGLVHEGQEAVVSLASEPGKSRLAVVSYVNPTVDTATRTLRVRLEADSNGGKLKPGMFTTVELASPIGDALAVPEDAVIDTGDRKVVFVQVEEGRYQPREVTLGRKGQGYLEVLKGLTAGERVVVSAQFLLDSESRLRGAAGGAGHGGH